jgi:hypothetical protein
METGYLPMFVSDNDPTDPVNIILVQLHLVPTLKGLIIPIKSFSEWTVNDDKKVYCQ